LEFINEISEETSTMESICIGEAKRFSCEDEEDEGYYEDESASLARVASKEPTQSTKKPVAKRTQLSPSHPALIVEIIRKLNKKHLTQMDIKFLRERLSRRKIVGKLQTHT